MLTVQLNIHSNILLQHGYYNEKLMKLISQQTNNSSEYTVYELCICILRCSLIVSFY